MVGSTNYVKDVVAISKKVSKRLNLAKKLSGLTDHRSKPGPTAPTVSLGSVRQKRLKETAWVSLKNPTDSVRKMRLLRSFPPKSRTRAEDLYIDLWANQGKGMVPIPKSLEGLRLLLGVRTFLRRLNYDVNEHRRCCLVIPQELRSIIHRLPTRYSENSFLGSFGDDDHFKKLRNIICASLRNADRFTNIALKANSVLEASSR